MKTFQAFLENQISRKNKPFSSRSVEKYCAAISTLSDEYYSILPRGKMLTQLNLNEFLEIKQQIVGTDSFQEKNTRGKSMYSRALDLFEKFLFENDISQVEIEDIIPTETEKMTIAKSRIVQGKFRNELLQKYKKCIISGITTNTLLVASHIKPWAASNHKERIDVNNGLLLCANIDKLFDRGLITFNNQGFLMISSQFNLSDTEKLQLSTTKQYQLKGIGDFYTYLEYHRRFIFKK